MANIPNKANGDVLYAVDLFKIVVNDTTGVDTSGTGETTLLSATISANQVSQGVVIFALVHFDGFDTGQSGVDGTIKLKIGAAGSESIVQTIQVKHQETTSHSRENTTLLYFDSSQTWTNAISILVTGQVTDTESTLSGVFLTVLGV